MLWRDFFKTGVVAGRAGGVAVFWVIGGEEVRLIPGIGHAVVHLERAFDLWVKPWIALVVMGQEIAVNRDGLVFVAEEHAHAMRALNDGSRNLGFQSPPKTGRAGIVRVHPE